MHLARRSRALALNLLVGTLSALVVGATPVAAQDWPNLGGNAARNGLSSELGPIDDDLAWSNATDFSIIAWHPYIAESRVFAIRESGFPSSGGAANDALIAYDLDTGVEIWRTTLTFAGNTATEWIAWIAGVANGKVYASRATNGAPGPIRAYDAATGAFLWNSIALTQAFAYDGIVFAPDGDLIVADHLGIARIDGNNGSTVWAKVRNCSVSNNCGPAATETAIFIDQVAAGGHIITKLDIATGNPLYSSSVMPGFTEQNQPFVSPDGGTVYLARTQNNVLTDFLYAFTDDGTQLALLWNVPVRWTTSHEHGIAADGSIYTFTQANEFVRLDPATGVITANAGVLSPIGTGNLSPKTVVDGAGNVYVSNGWAGTPSTNGRVWAFNADLSVNHFTLTLDNPNQGGPALGNAGTLVVADLTSVRAYRCGVLASASFRNAGTNPASYSLSGAPILGGNLTATIDLSTSGHSLALLLGYAGPLQFGLPGGQTLLVDVTHPAGELLGLAAVAGPLAQYVFAPLPDDPGLCGISLSTQALHFGGGPFALSNAYDLILGTH